MKAPRPARHYRAEAMGGSDSVGLLIKKALQSLQQQIDLRLVQHDLTHAQWVPLYKLYRGECATMAELARELQADPAGMTRALDRLEAKGLIRRERSADDRRVVKLALTDEGRRVAPIVPATLAEVFNAHLAGFSHDEWQTLVTLLQRLVANGEALKEQSMAKESA